jgi:hypothetical protein
MNNRSAHCANQSDPQSNPQFRRWPAPATGDSISRIRTWHADEVPLQLRNPCRQRAERDWAQALSGSTGSVVLWGAE